MTATILEFPVRRTTPVSSDPMFVAMETYNSSTNPSERASLRTLMLHLNVVEIIEYHGTFSSLDLEAFDAQLEAGAMPYFRRRPRTEYPLLSGGKTPLLSGAELSPSLTLVSNEVPRDSGEVAGSDIASDSEDTIKGPSQRSNSALSTPQNNTGSPVGTHCDSNTIPFQDVLLPLPTEWLPSEVPSDSFGLTQDAKTSTMEQDAEEPSRPLDALDVILASYREQGEKVTTHFDADAIRAMRNRFNGREKDGSPKKGTLDMSPILDGGNRVLATVMLVEDGMEDLTGADLYNFRKQMFARYESAFSVKMSCIWKLEFVPAEKSKMVGKHAEVGYAHMHFNLPEPTTRSAHSRKSQFSKDFNGMTPAEWFEATARDIMGVIVPKKRSMTHFPKRGERGEYPARYSDAVDQMVNYFAKQGKPYAAKRFQNHVPLNWLARGEIHLKFWGANALERF